jgi:peptidylprolyl isomerase
MKGSVASVVVSGVVLMYGLAGCEKPAANSTTGAAATPNAAPAAAPAPIKTHAVNPDVKDEAKPATAAPATKPAPSTPAPSSTPPAAPKEPAAVTPPAPSTPPATPATPKKQELPGGLILEDLVVGTGAECKPNATVTIHYRGTLENGEEFDSSYSRGQPATFPLGRLIKGWQEGIPGMKVGGKRKLTIPYQLGYGERGSPPKIPPKATLIFEIEMFDTK